MPAATLKVFDIVCFEHCQKKIFSLQLPQNCPECNQDLSECDLKIPPFKLPNPFSRAQDHPCSVVIKPTRGDFLEDYQNRSNLHIAATNSKGFVVEYDQKGIHRDQTLQWSRCIAIDLSTQLDTEITLDPDWGEYWDLCLRNTSENFRVDSYDEENNNCFTFILEFLKTLKQNPISRESANRIEFCQKYILPKTILAGKYICLFRKVRDNGGIYVQALKKRSSTEKPPPPAEKTPSPVEKTAPTPPDEKTSASPTTQLTQNENIEEDQNTSTC